MENDTSLEVIISQVGLEDNVASDPTDPATDNTDKTDQDDDDEIMDSTGDKLFSNNITRVNVLIITIQMFWCI